MSTSSHARVRRKWLFYTIMLLWLFVQGSQVLAAQVSEGDDDDNSSGPSHGSDHHVDDPTTQRRITNQQLQTQTKVANYIAVAGVTLYVWEYLCTLAHELYIWLHPRYLLRPQIFLFMAIRYLSIPALVVPLYGMWGNIKDQSDCPKHEQITVAIVQFVVSCIFSWRTIAIWRRRRWVVVFLTTFTVLLFVTSISLLYYSQDAYLITRECRPALIANGDHDAADLVHPVNTVQWFYLTCIIFDTVIVILSMYKLLMYANMGRTVNNTIAFRDPFEAYRQQQQQQQQQQNEPEKNVVPDVEAIAIDPRERRASNATILFRGLRSSMVDMLLFPYRKASALYSWWSSLTPLVARLMRNGVLYFVVATAYSVNNFTLEVLQSLHSKSFLTLYAPLMCVMCQRMLLTEFVAVWRPYDDDSVIPGRNLVDAVTGQKRRPAQSDIDRFELFASILEERHASVVSPRSPRAMRTWRRMNSQPRTSRGPPESSGSRDTAMDPPLSTESNAPPYAPPSDSQEMDLSSNSADPSEKELGQARSDVPHALGERPVSPSPSIVPPGPPLVARHRLIHLSQAQQEQALRMAGFS
ncbi:hypothetical protein MEQU1_003420 [Malassezia equina]|uniref:DUF6533 domain-containing protein n=1 Tax=Malassezia equina TaxID=1381935 RepID=A0AAF0EEA0_9BASI|nr:hypothetical protein MEQU1_003420 [Malassezia equina]